MRELENNAAIGPRFFAVFAPNTWLANAFLGTTFLFVMLFSPSGQTSDEIAPYAVSEALPLKLDVRDERLSRLVPASSKLEKVAGGFMFIEGPVWRDDHLLFSDIPANRIYRWEPDAVTVAVDQVHDPDIVTGAQGGSNGLIEDQDGSLLLFVHGLRRIDRIANGVRTVVADKWRGQRLNSPNDGVVHSSGALYFTDPPYGLPQQDEDPGKEITANGVYRLDLDGTVTQLTTMHRPNGIGLSPDEKTLYVASSDLEKKWWMKFPVEQDRSLGTGEIHFDARDLTDPGVPDGFVVDQHGNIWASGPGGVVVIAPDGTHLGTILTPELPANTTFGKDESSLFITARTGLYRLSLPNH
ncbi:MAG: SMP-30/gluconolactonase/LRE family protein [Pseudomonadales bacterium]|nr:SMP-30/gluconolactonase/LRE family protein [Pseudomonadales bacterium]